MKSVLTLEANDRQSIYELLNVVGWGVQALKHARIVGEVDRHHSIIREVETEVDTCLLRAHAVRPATRSKGFAAT
jgi:hypothetical protein